MRILKSIGGILLLCIVIVIIGWIIWNIASWYQGKKENFQKQLGTYVLDTYKTELGNYSKDSNIYKNLRITFKSDNTFYMNMKVPFIYDSTGKWNAGSTGLEDWNWLWYKAWGYSNYKEDNGNQFTPPWTNDSIFYINAAKSQDGAEGIQEIYFRKIKNKIH